MSEELKEMEEQEEAYTFGDDDGDWDDITDWGEETDESSEEELDSNSQTEEADQQESEEADEQTEAEEQAEPEAEDADQWLELKHLDETRKVNKEEAKELAQKGMDYDRIRQERDDLKSNLPRYQEMEKFLKEMQGDFDSIEEFMDDTRARIRADAEGISYNEALDQVKASRNPAPQQSKPDGINADAFVAKYPNVKAEEIPASVWADVQVTGDLVASYDKYAESQKNDEIARLKEEIETLKRNQKNTARSAGSSKSSGASSKSLVDLLWDDDD